MSRKFLNALEARIEEAGGEDVAIFERMANGDSMAEIAEDLGCSRSFLYTWRKRKGHRERRLEKWKDAMRVRALAKAEEGENILDAMSENGEEITTAKVGLARERANYKKWLAGKLDPEQFGDHDQKVSVALNVGSLHLEALRAVNAAHALPEPEIPEAEYEEIED